MAKATYKIGFNAKLHRPGGDDKGEPWLFLNLPDDASRQLPTRSMVSVEGTLNESSFLTTLEPDGEGGHWMKVEEALQKSAGVNAGDTVDVEIVPASKEPEPDVPADLKAALEAAGSKVLALWADITPVARRDWIKWITSGKKAETRVKRVEVAISKLSAGSRRPCCFDRSGMYSKSMSCPVPDTSE